MGQFPTIEATLPSPHNGRIGTCSTGAASAHVCPVIN